MPSTAVPTQPPLAPGLKTSLLRGAALAANRGAGVAAQMSVQIAVGALAGPAGIGLLQLHMAWTSLLGEVVGAGEPTRALRDNAVRSGTGCRSGVLPALRRPALRILGFSVLLALVTALAVALGLSDALGEKRGPLLLSILLSAPLFALLRLLAETLKALDQASRAVLLENTVMPLTILAACAAMAAGLWAPTPGLLLGAAVAGLLAALLLMRLALARSTGITTPAAAHSEAGQVTTPRGEQLHFWLISLLNIAFLQLPFLLMPWLLTPEDIGRYAVAHKLVNVITTLLILMAAIYAPRFARAAARGNGPELAGLLRETQRISLILFTPAAGAMLLLADPLTALFSLEAHSLLPLLAVLVAGQLCNAATGLAGVLLNMSGAAQWEFRLLLLSCVLTSVLALIGGLQWGVTGVAAAIAVGIALRNAASYCAARRHIASLIATRTTTS